MKPSEPEFSFEEGFKLTSQSLLFIGLYGYSVFWGCFFVFVCASVSIVCAFLGTGPLYLSYLIC